LGHEGSLTQCLANLLGNAVKFVASGQTPRIAIRTQALDGEVRIWIEDQGIGIAPEDQGCIFGMFERLRTDYPGTGIGLAIVRKAVERMGGAVGLESAPGKGSKFWIQLPAG
jgi:signal transduction histidine kinase